MRQLQNSVSDKLASINGVMFNQWILICIVDSIKGNKAASNFSTVKSAIYSEVERSLPSSTPLILQDLRVVSKEALVCKVYTQGASNGTAGICGIPRFLHRLRCRDATATTAAAAAVSIDRPIIERTYEASRKLPNYAARKRRSFGGEKTGKRGCTMVGNARWRRRRACQRQDLCALACRVHDTRHAEDFNALFLLRRACYVLSLTFL